MKKQRSFFRTQNPGFTLIELLVSMSISSVLLLVLLAIINQTTAGYTQSQRSISHLSQARAFIQLFDSELSTRVPETPLIHRASSEKPSENFDQIAFVRVNSPHEQNPDQPGDLTTHFYYVDFVTEPNQQLVPKLFRKILTPGETQKLIEAGDVSEALSADPESDEPVIDSVLGFKATPKFFNPVTGNDEPWNEASEHPATILELTIHIIDDSSLRRFTTPEAWNRLATSPTENERQLIRKFHHIINIGK